MLYMGYEEAESYLKASFSGFFPPKLAVHTIQNFTFQNTALCRLMRAVKREL